MRYMVMIKSSCNSESGQPPNLELMAGMDKLREEMTRAGIMLCSEGLLPSSTGTRIHYVDGKRHITDGPFIEAKELVGGFAILKVTSKQQAIDLANQVVDLHIQCGLNEINMELRPLFDPPE